MKKLRRAHLLMGLIVLCAALAARTLHAADPPGAPEPAVPATPAPSPAPPAAPPTPAAQPGATRGASPASPEQDKNKDKKESADNNVSFPVDI